MGLDFGDSQGLISGLASGLQSGMDAYEKEDDRRRRIAETQMKIEAQKLKAAQDAQNRKLDTNIKLASGGLLSDPSGQVSVDPNSPITQDRTQKSKLAQDSFELRKQELAQKKNDAAAATSNKAGEKENKYYEDLIKQAESARGAPAVMAAERDLYASQKADTLVEKLGSPDKLSPRMFNLYATEIGRIAQGGVPTIHELEGLDPKTLKGSAARAWERLSGEPTPANLGAFVREYQTYAHAITEDARTLLNNRYSRLGESYRHLTGDENYDRYVKQYVNRFQNEDAALTSAKTAAAGPSKLKPAQPKVVRQNGHDFILNEATGEYE